MLTPPPPPNPGSAPALHLVAIYFDRPQTKFAKLMFLQVSVCPHGGTCGFILEACLVLLGGMHGFIWGVCGFIWGCVHGFIWGVHGFIRGHAWFYLGGMCGFIHGACVVFPGGGVHVFFSFFGYNEMQSMSGRYASYWNAFLYDLFLQGQGGMTPSAPRIHTYQITVIPKC